MTTRPPAPDGLGQIRANLVSQITDSHVGVLRTLVRIELRRNAKKRARLIETFGEDADVLHVAEKQDLLRDLYRMLDRDPENITNVRGEESGDDDEPVCPSCGNSRDQAPSMRTADAQDVPQCAERSWHYCGEGWPPCTRPWGHSPYDGVGHTSTPATRAEDVRP
jgi:hypothetical protein